MRASVLRLSCLFVSMVAIVSPAGSLRAADALDAPDAAELVRASFHHYRGQSSYGRMRMTIHRPEWERSQTLQAWTRGETDSVIIITEPARDRGNGTLKRGEQMWTYSPRVNRVIKLPPSLMGQAWMGSDFTNHDLARSDSIIVDYDHEIVSREEREGLKVHRVRLTPRPGAPVVWGAEELLIREDLVVLEERFFDQDGQLVKSLVSSQIEMIGGRLLPRVLTMVQAADAERYTRVEYLELEFKERIADRYFTETFLRNPGS